MWLITSHTLVIYSLEWKSKTCIVSQLTRGGPYFICCPHVTGLAWPATHDPRFAYVVRIVVRALFEINALNQSLSWPSYQVRIRWFFRCTLRISECITTLANPGKFNYFRRLSAAFLRTNRTIRFIYSLSLTSEHIGLYPGVISLLGFWTQILPPKHMYQIKKSCGTGVCLNKQRCNNDNSSYCIFE